MAATAPAATAPAATGYAPAQQQAYAQQQAQLYAQQQQAQAYAQQAQQQQAQAYAQQAQQQRYAAPPPLPTEARAAARGGGGSSSLVMVVVLLVIVAAGGYAYFTGALDKMLGKGGGGGGLGKEGDTGTSASANPPPPTEAERKLQMEGCKAKGMPHATCELNPASGTVMGKCHEGYYGTDCTRRCRTGGARATVYTPGFAEGGGGGEATCVCPSGSHFRNSDVVNGCELGDETGDACEAGWHGERCDKGGDFQNCQNGTQNASTGACDCTGGYQGKLCQYPSDWCTKTDSTATFDKATEKCVCSKEYTGSRCNDASAGYILKDGKAVDWTSVYTDLSSAQVTFKGAGHTTDWGKKSCGDSNNCTQTVGVCSLLSSKEGGVQGCSTIDSLCKSGAVGWADGRCSLMEAGANLGKTGKIIAGASMATAALAVDAATAGAATVGEAALAAGTKGTFGISIANQNPWFSSVDVPENLEFGVWKGDDCVGSDPRRALGQCVQSQCTYSSPTYQDSLAFQFKLPSGSYAKCGSTYYVGSGVKAGGKEGSAPTANDAKPQFVSA